MLWDLLIVVIVCGLVGVALASILQSQIIYPGSVGLLYTSGRFVRELPPGRSTRIDLFKRTRIVVVPTTPQSLHGFALAVMTKDQFAFRMTVTPIFQIEDARAYAEAEMTAQLSGTLPTYSGMQFSLLQPRLAAAMMEAVSARTLGEFLAAPRADLDAVRDQLNDALPGARLLELLLTDFTVPPEVRKMLTEVERAKHDALAMLERARGEQASLRALANAARSLKSNPELAQLRLLQTIENTKGNKTIILGQPMPHAGGTEPDVIDA